MFPTRYRKPERFCSGSGSSVKVLYSPVFDKKGVMHLEESGREDLYGFIQSHKDSVDLHIILERYASGDVSALQRAQGFFADVTQFPATYSELLNTVVAGERSFDALPVDVKQRFGNSFHQWLAQAGTDDWLVAMGMKPQPESQPEPQSEPEKE